MTSTVADSLWGSTPIITCSTALLLRWLFVAIGTARWAVLLRAGQSPLEPRLVTVPDGLQTGSEPHPQAASEQPHRERPAGHLGPSLARLRPYRESFSSSRGMTVKRKAAVRPMLVSIAVPYAEPFADVE